MGRKQISTLDSIMNKQIVLIGCVMRWPFVEYVLAKFAATLGLPGSAQEEHDSKTNCKEYRRLCFGF